MRSISEEIHVLCTLQFFGSYTMLCNFEILAFESTVTVNINWRRWKGPWTTWIGKSRWKSENLYIYLQRCARLVVVIPSHLIHSASSSILSLSLLFEWNVWEKLKSFFNYSRVEERRERRKTHSYKINNIFTTPKTLTRARSRCKGEDEWGTKKAKAAQ